MNDFGIKDIKKLSRNYRGIASRLIKTDVDDGIINLKKFLNFIQSDTIIMSFIESKNKKIFNVENDIKRLQNSQSEYTLPENNEDEIGYVYQFLCFTAEKCECYYHPISYAYGHKLQEQVDNFNHRIVLPFINYITTFLDELLIDLEDDKMRNALTINANDSQINIANDSSKIEANQNSIKQQNDLNAILQILSFEIKKLEVGEDRKEDAIELIEVAKEELEKDKPKKAIIKMAIEKINEFKELGTSSIEFVNTAHEAIRYLSDFLS